MRLAGWLKAAQIHALWRTAGGFSVATSLDDDSVHSNVKAARSPHLNQLPNNGAFAMQRLMTFAVVERLADADACRRVAPRGLDR